MPEFPVVHGLTVELSHDAGNLDFNVDNHATLPFYMKYNDVQQSDRVGGWLDETFFFFDQAQYEHTGVHGDIATGRKDPPGSNEPEFDTTLSDVPLYLADDGVLDKSLGSFTKVKDINGQENDIRLFQTAYSKLGEDWGIFQWTVQNLYDTNLSEVRFGLKFYSCTGGDNTDDKAYWEPADKVYYIKDSGSATYIGFASADPQKPINMYWDDGINNLYYDKDIYDASVASPYVSGFSNDLGCIVGWTDNETMNNGLTLGAYESITRSLIIVGGTSYNNILSAINSARDFYLPRTLMITEIADSGIPRVEIYNTASTQHDLTSICLSTDSGSTFWSDGGWDVNPVPGNGYSVWTLAGGDAFDSTEGDTIGLYNTSQGLLCDEVAFGQEGMAPDPMDDPTIGSISRALISDWVHSLDGMTFGARNNENNSIERTPDVVLNEVMFNPSAPEYGFIELMYIGDASIDIDGYRIFTDSYFDISGSHILNPSDPFYLIFRDDAPWLFENQNMSISGDNVYLYNSEDCLLDMVGWNDAHQINRTVTRINDGRGTYQGYNNITSEAAGWMFDANQTIPLVNIGPVGQFEYGDPGDELWYNLTITNTLDHQELFNIFNISLPEDWMVELYSNFMGAKLTDSNSDGSPDIIVDALSSVNISIKVTIPSTGIYGDYGTATISIFANSNSAITHYVSVESRLNPYLFPDKYITPSTININGTGYNEEATITLKVTGKGFGIAVELPQDLVFVFDRSESMLQSEIDVAKQAMTEYVENMSSPDTGAVVHFDSNVVLMGHLTANHNKLINDISNIPGPGDLTYMGEAMLEALNELEANGNSDHSHVIILLTDGGWNGAIDPEDVANWARENDTYIYTISIGGGGESLLREIANITGAEYFYAETAEDLRGIFTNISIIIDKTAGRDPDINDANPMVRDILPPWIDYVPGSFSQPPDHIYINESGYTICEWNISRVLIDEVWEVTFDITASLEGLQEANNYTESRISYINWEGSIISRLFPRTLINVIDPPPPEPLPPMLFIEVINDSGIRYGRGDHIRLNWTAPSTEGVTHYLIYRSHNQRDFDFQNPWVNTSSYSDNGIIPLRTTLNDTNSAKPGDPNYQPELYYTIRAVNSVGNASSNSRTVGKWTRQFQEDESTFSLPLEPIMILGTDWYVADMNAEYIKWMDDTHQWVKHDPGDGSIDNTSILVGCGYEVKFQNAEKYSFVGLPGAMISYDDDASFEGFDPNSNAKNLTASVKDYDVAISITLNWLRPAQMEIGVDQYKVYYSNTRDGFWGQLGVDYKLYKTVDVGTENANLGFLPSPDMQYYFMVVPVLSTGEIGTSTYSIGIFCPDYDSEYDTIGLPLKPTSLKTVDWYCDVIPDNLGINYYDYPEQRWIWHKQVMPAGAYDVIIEMGRGYQISMLNASRYAYVGF